MSKKQTVKTLIKYRNIYVGFGYLFFGHFEHIATVQTGLTHILHILNKGKNTYRPSYVAHIYCLSKLFSIGPHLLTFRTLQNFIIPGSVLS